MTTRIDATDERDIERQLRTWLQAEAAAAAPAALRDRIAVIRPVPAHRPWGLFAPRRVHVTAGVRGRAGSRSSLLAFAVMLAGALLLAAWALAGQQPDIPRFAAGSIAYTEQGTLYVAAADDSAPVRYADDPNLGNSVSNLFAFSPDRRSLAYSVATTRPDGTSGETLVGPLAADGTMRGSYDGASGDAMGFAWSPDSQHLAVYSAGLPHELVLVDGSGRQAGSIPLPSGLAFHYKDFPADVSWSPDGHWIALGSCAGGCDTSPAATLIVGADGPGTTWLTVGTDRLIPAHATAWTADSQLTVSAPCTGQPACTPTMASMAGTLSRTGLVTDRFALPEPPIRLAWSPDGSALAAGATDLASILIARDGSPLVIQPGQTCAPTLGLAWSGSGRVMCLGTPGSAPGFELWSVDALTGGSSLVVDGVGPQFAVAGP